jgi:hypothetical protein
LHGTLEAQTPHRIDAVLKVLDTRNTAD